MKIIKIVGLSGLVKFQSIGSLIELKMNGLYITFYND